MVGMNKAAGKSGRKTAMDYALDAGMHDETIAVKKFAVLGYLSEKGEKHLSKGWVSLSMSNLELTDYSLITRNDFVGGGAGENTCLRPSILDLESLNTGTETCRVFADRAACHMGDTSRHV